MEPRGAALQDAQVFIASLDEVDLSRFRVVGTYTRYEEAVRNALQDARQKILAGFETPGRKRENHLIWAAPGTGKTYFVQQIATSLGDGVRYHEINLAKCTEPEFRAALGRLDNGQPCLCLIDEADAKPQEPWPYEALLPYLDAAVERAAQFVFVLTGSSGTSLEDIKQRIAARPKGADLLSRIPTGHEHVIGPMSLGDRLLIVLSQLRQAGQETGREIRAIEKLGLYYVAFNPRLDNARQLREFAVRAVERVPKTDDRVKYDHLFAAGDPDNKAFWVQASPLAERLVNSFVILTGDHAEPTRPLNFPPLKAVDERRNNLPIQLTSFVGREKEIAEVRRLLAASRLVTLTGTGGGGKTRLALRIADDLVDQYSDGVWLVRLASLSDAALVPQAAATALNIPERPGRPLLETVATYLRPKTALIVLDNCEHLLQACVELVDMVLRLAPNVRVLATSREVLGIEGELIYRIPSLSVPDPNRVPPLDALSRFDAVRLFIERAAFSKPGFEITNDNAAMVAQVVDRLDGLPLAIELAAARVKALPVEVIADRLDDRFRLLTGGSRTSLPRHQKLRATLDWSYDLLSEDERILFRRLSVFAGGFTLEAAEEVCASEGLAEGDILDLLTRLVDKSLVTFGEREGHARYRLLDSVRQYGLDRLLASGETAQARTRHLAWYLGLTERANPEMYGPDDTEWADRLEVEHDNLRTALGWSTSGNAEAQITLRLAWALWWFWDLHTHWSEGRRWMESALTRSGGIKSVVRVRTLWGAGRFAWRQADYTGATARYEESLALARELDDQTGVAMALTAQGVILSWQGDWAAALSLHEKSLHLSRKLNDTWLTALALLHMTGITRSGGSLQQEHYAMAVARGEESLALFRTLGSKRWTALALFLTGHAVRLQGDLDRATALYRESLLSFRENRDKWIGTECVTGLALIDSARGNAERAARLLGAVEAAREEFGIAVLRTRAGGQEQFWTTLRERPAETPFAAAWAEGRAMSLDQAIEYALAERTQ